MAAARREIDRTGLKRLALRSFAGRQAHMLLEVGGEDRAEDRRHVLRDHDRHAARDARHMAQQAHQGLRAARGGADHDHLRARLLERAGCSGEATDMRRSRVGWRSRSRRKRSNHATGGGGAGKERIGRGWRGRRRRAWCRGCLLLTHRGADAAHGEHLGDQRLPEIGRGRDLAMVRGLGKVIRRALHQAAHRHLGAVHRE